MWQAFLFFLTLLLSLLAPVRDTDFGWHYRCGQELLTTGMTCFTNTYSYYLTGYKWGYSSALYDLSIAWLYNYFGFWGVSIFGALLLLIAAFIFYTAFKRSKTIYLSILLTFIASWSVLGLGYRAQVLSFVFLSFEFFLIKKLWQAQRRELGLNLIILVLLALWSNSHPGFVLGVGIYGLFSLLQVMNKRYYYAFFAFLGILASLINPLGWRTYFEVMGHYTTDLSKLIAEWTAPNTHWQVLIVFVAVLFLFYNLSFKNRRPKDYFYLILLIVLSVITFKAKRHLPLYFLSLGFIAEEYRIPELLWQRTNLSQELLNYSLFTVLSLYSLVNIGQVNTNFCQAAFVELPCQAITHLPKGTKKLYTAYEWGGYLIWQKPRVKVFVDGRMPAWKTKSGKSPYTVYLEIIQARSGWEKTLLHYNTDTLLIGNGTFLDLELQKGEHANWQETYRDKLAVIYKRL